MQMAQELLQELLGRPRLLNVALELKILRPATSKGLSGLRFTSYPREVPAFDRDVSANRPVCHQPLGGRPLRLLQNALFRGDPVDAGNA